MDEAIQAKFDEKIKELVTTSKKKGFAEYICLDNSTHVQQVSHKCFRRSKSNTCET